MVENQNLDTVVITELTQYLLLNNISNNYSKKIIKFNLTLDNGSEILIDKLIRVLPGRRLVLSGQMNSAVSNQKVIIKLFINSQKCTADYNNLLVNYNLLLKSGFATPLVIFSNCFANNISYIIYEFIQKDNYDGMEDYEYKLIIEAIANLHSKNIYQSDLHLDNFIISKNKVFYLDLQSLEHGFGVTKFDRVLGDQTALDNFALFLAQLDITNHHKWTDFILYYLHCRNIRVNTQELVRYLLSLTESKLNIRVNNFVKKCQRNSSLTKVIESNFTSFYGGLCLQEEFADGFESLLNEFMLDPAKFLAKYTSKILKHSNKAQVLLISYQGREFILKHYVAKNLLMTIIANIKYFFINPRSLKSWLNSNLLLHIGIKTAKPIALVHRSKHSLIYESYFFMEYLHDFKRLNDLLDSSLSTTKVKYLDKVYELLAYFKLLKITHRDFKTVNIGFINDKITVLDLDSMQKYKSNLLFSNVVNKDLNRFNKCIEKL